MSNNVNTRIVSALIDHVKDNGGNADLLFEASEYPKQHLMEPDRFVSNEFLIIMFAQARQMLSDPRVAHAAGRRVAKRALNGVYRGRAFVLGYHLDCQRSRKLGIHLRSVTLWGSS